MFLIKRKEIGATKIFIVRGCIFISIEKCKFVETDILNILLPKTITAAAKPLRLVLNNSENNI